GRVLPPHPGPLWRGQGGRGDGAQDRGAGVSGTEIRPGGRAPGGAGLRRGGPAADPEGAGAQGREPWLPPGAGDDVRGARAGGPPKAQRPDGLSNDPRQPAAGAGGEGVARAAENGSATRDGHAGSMIRFLGRRFLSSPSSQEPLHSGSPEKEVSYAPLL